MHRKRLIVVLKKLRLDLDRETSEGWFIAHCPFAPWTHKKGTDRAASFCVKANPHGHSGFNCFTCKQRGNIPALIASLGFYRKKNYTELRMNAHLWEMEITPDRDFDEEVSIPEKPKPLSEKAISGMYDLVWSAKEARIYLKKRGISRSTCEVLGMLFDPDEKRILFPVRDRQQRLFGFSGRTILPDNEVPRGWPRARPYPKVKDYHELPKQHLLLGEHLIDPNKPNVVVEGLFAEAHFVEIGVEEVANPVATLGSVMSVHQAAILEELGRPTYLFYDRDKAGRAGMMGYDNEAGRHIYGAGELLWDKVPTFRPKWPKGFYDPDNLNLDQVKRMMRVAVPLAF